MNRSLSTERSAQGLQSGVRASCVATITLLLTGLAIPNALAQPAKSTEPDVKAAYLVNFGKFLRETAAQTPRKSFDICLLGHDSMGRTIDDLAANQGIDNVQIRVRRIPDVSQAKACAIVFISADEGDRLREDLAILSPSGALTVSDASDFLDRGGMIQFLVIGNRLRFAVNLNAVNRAHLVLSSELLRVASSVTGKPPTGDQP